MMDYYSQFSAPSTAQCRFEIKSTIIKPIHQISSVIGKLGEYDVDELISQAFTDSNVLDKNGNIKYSLSGWYVFGKTDVLRSIESILEKRRKDKLRRKVRGLLISSFVLISAYNNTVERLYHPDSEFVSHVLKSEFESACANNS